MIALLRIIQCIEQKVRKEFSRKEKQTVRSTYESLKKRNTLFLDTPVNATSEILKLNQWDTVLQTKFTLSRRLSIFNRIRKHYRTATSCGTPPGIHPLKPIRAYLQWPELCRIERPTRIESRMLFMWFIVSHFPCSKPAKQQQKTTCCNRIRIEPLLRVIPLAKA